MWETDPDCQAVTTFHFPDIVHRGDLIQDSAQSLAEDIRACDPSSACLIMVAAGPPCPDFSSITDKSNGREGAEGSKFITLCNFLQALTERLPSHVIIFGIENVVMNDQSDTNYFSDRLGVQPVLIDGGDMGLVSRPRLWWIPLDWSAVHVHPLTGGQLQWTKS